MPVAMRIVRLLLLLLVGLATMPACALPGCGGHEARAASPHHHGGVERTAPHDTTGKATPTAISCLGCAALPATPAVAMPMGQADRRYDPVAAPRLDGTGPPAIAPPPRLRA